MIFVKILGYGVATVIMTFFFGSIAFSLWFLLSLGVEMIRKAPSGKRPKEQKYRWWPVQILPGLLTQIWYASFVAFLIHAVRYDTSPGMFIAIHIAGAVGLLTAAVLFDLMHRRGLQCYENPAIPLAVGGVTFGAWLVMLALPKFATVGRYWEKGFAIVLQGLIEGVLD